MSSVHLAGYTEQHVQDSFAMQFAKERLPFTNNDPANLTALAVDAYRFSDAMMAERQKRIDARAAEAADRRALKDMDRA